MSRNLRIVTTYAKSFFQNIQKGKNSTVSDDSGLKISKITSSEQTKFVPNILMVGEELLLLRAALISSAKLKEVFKNPTFFEQQKLDILLTVFPGLTINTKSFLKVLTERSHLFLIPEICDEYQTILLKFKNTIRVRVITASPLEDRIGSLLLKTLQKVTNSTDILLSTSYNPKLLGGLILQYNSVAIDASVLKEFSLFFNDA